MIIMHTFAKLHTHLLIIDKQSKQPKQTPINIFKTGRKIQLLMTTLAVSGSEL